MGTQCEESGFAMLHLPHALHHCVCTQWLSLCDISKLDSAFCSQSTRKEYLESVQKMVLRECEYATSIDFLKWLLKRNIFATTLALNQFDEPLDIAPHELLILQYIDVMGPNLTSISFYCTGSFDEICFSIANNCREKLASIYFCDCTLGKNVRLLLSKCTSLTTISFIHCENIAYEEYQGLLLPKVTSIHLGEIATDLMVVSLSYACPNLTKLYCSNSTDSLAKSLAALAINCPKLKILHVFECEFSCEVNNNIFENLTELNLKQGLLLRHDNVITLVAKCKNLEKLSLSNENKEDFDEINDAVIIAIANNCPKLVDFRIAFCSNPLDVGLLVLATNCQLMRRLAITEINFSAATALALVQHFEQLEDISFTFLSLNDAVIVHLAKHCKKLRRIAIDRCTGITEIGVEALALYCVSLREVHVNSMCCDFFNARVCVLWRIIRPEIIFSGINLHRQPSPPIY